MIKKIILLLSLFFVYVVTDARSITIKQSKPLYKQLNKEGAIYKIKKTIDLKGGVVVLPKDSQLKFMRNGFISNGTIVGNGSSIQSKDRVIFDNIKIDGKWIIPVIYINWMRLAEDNSVQQVQEILKFQDSNFENIIFFPNRPLYWTPKQDNYSLINLESKTTLYLMDSIYTNVNNCPYYRVINVVGKNDISVNGGVLVGDVEHHVYNGTTSHEWGFGVNIERAHNIEINGTTSMLFPGDGFYIGGEKENVLGENTKGCKNIHLNGVRALFNRRQGLSVTGSMDGLFVSDSEFSYTGEKGMTMPGAGVDFEVNYDTQRMTDIFFNKCLIKGNRKGLCLLNKKGNGTFVFNNVIIDPLPFFNEEQLQYEVYPFHGVVLSGDYESISFDSCQLGAISNMTTVDQQLPNNVNISNSVLSIIYTRSISDTYLRSFNISNCTIDVSNQRFYDQGIHDTEKKKEIGCMMYCASVVDFTLDNCEFKTGNTGIKTAFFDTDRNARICIKNCVINKELLFPHYNASFYNCHIIFPTFRWLALRKGMVATWENNVIEITEPSSSFLSVTQVRGEGNPPLFVFKNNVFIGKANNYINKNLLIKDECHVVFEKNTVKGEDMHNPNVLSNLSRSFMIDSFVVE